MNPHKLRPVIIERRRPLPDLHNLSGAGVLRALADAGHPVDERDIQVREALERYGIKLQSGDDPLTVLIESLGAALAESAKKPKARTPDERGAALSQRELHVCRELGLNPATYAANRARRDAARQGGVR
jgi:hypothetical protein